MRFEEKNKPELTPFYRDWGFWLVTALCVAGFWVAIR